MLVEVVCLVLLIFAGRVVDVILGGPRREVASPEGDRARTLPSVAAVAVLPVMLGGLPALTTSGIVV